ncbi:hypothetical protein B0I35DRAFT_140761 [Stachybotrys elegans]|uniref:Transmembrane protein n=1 Tax=Stachybotrys elegans TaxID=80388 RepID=A0A8K0WX88_9HYPO|nr:hypothetical protein B0I35DRAFT_140761 [Stachybotrys elegans]
MHPQNISGDVNERSVFIHFAYSYEVSFRNRHIPFLLPFPGPGASLSRCWPLPPLLLACSFIKVLWVFLFGLVCGEVLMLMGNKNKKDG